MADKKISQLSSASTPLAGTEVLPIVQSSATVKVATNDLTVKNVRSNATTGILQIAGPAAASTRTMTVPDANFTVARTDAANSFTGDQTLATGNIIQGTAAKGFNFSANTGAAGKSSDLLNWYEEGTFAITALTTAGAGASGTITVDTGFNTLAYTRIGRIVHVNGNVAVSSVGSPAGSLLKFETLPFPIIDLGEQAGRFGGGYGAFGTTAGDVIKPIYSIEGDSVWYLVIDTSTIQSGTYFYVGFTYTCA